MKNNWHESKSDLTVGIAFNGNVFQADDIVINTTEVDIDQSTSAWHSRWKDAFQEGIIEFFKITLGPWAVAVEVARALFMRK